MRKTRQLLLCIASFAFTAAQAQTADPYYNAADAYFQLISQAPQGSIPRLSEPKAQALIATLTEQQRIMDGKNYAIEEMGELFKRCEMVNNVAQSYIMFGLKNKVHMDGKDIAAMVRQFTVLSQGNAREFSNELMHLHPLVVKCNAKIGPMMENFAATVKKADMTALHVAALKQARVGATRLFSEMLVMMSDPLLSEEHKERILQPLADAAPDYYLLMEPNERASTVYLVQHILSESREKLQPPLARIAQIMAGTSCGAVCKL